MKLTGVVLRVQSISPLQQDPLQLVIAAFSWRRWLWGGWASVEVLLDGFNRTCVSSKSTLFIPLYSTKPTETDAGVHAAPCSSAAVELSLTKISLPFSNPSILFHSNIWFLCEHIHLHCRKPTLPTCINEVKVQLVRTFDCFITMIPLSCWMAELEGSLSIW